MDRSQWQPKRRLELQYQHLLDRLGRDILTSIEGLTDPFEIANVIRGWLTNRLFQHFAGETAQAVVGGLFRSSAKTWREAAREQSNGRAIYEALKRELSGPIGAAVDFQIKRNAELIRSMPLDIANDMVKYIEQESFRGRRASAIAEDILRKFPNVTKNKAKLIARTETSKTSTALTQARAESLNLPAYIWRTSEDQRVRKSHDHMDGVIVFWRDPPAPEALIGVKSTLGKYHAGNAPNCRCYPQPVVNLDYVSWPHKVYRNGTITTMTRAEFERIAV